MRMIPASALEENIMRHLNIQRSAMAFVICLFLAASEVFACGCGGSSDVSFSDAVNTAVNGSAMVFAGKVVGFEYRKGIPNEYMQSRREELGTDFEWETKVVKFKAERWWTGEPATEVFLTTAETKNSDGTGSGSGCDYRFQLGETYLVYAYRKGNELRTHSCSRTSLLSNTKDLQILGEGKEPVNKKGEPETIVLKYIELARLGNPEELAELVHVETPKRSKSYEKGADAPSDDVLFMMDQRFLLDSMPKMIVSGDLTSLEMFVLQKSRRSATIRSRLKSSFESDSTMTATFKLKDIGKGNWKIIQIELTPAVS